MLSPIVTNTHFSKAFSVVLTAQNFLIHMYKEKKNALMKVEAFSQMYMAVSEVFVQLTHVPYSLLPSLDCVSGHDHAGQPTGRMHGFMYSSLLHLSVRS